METRKIHEHLENVWFLIVFDSIGHHSHMHPLVVLSVWSGKYPKNEEDKEEHTSNHGKHFISLRTNQ